MDLDDQNRTRVVPETAQLGLATRMLVLATLGFLVNFWAWALISPLGAAYRDELGLSSFQQALLVAVPVVVGSLGRIPVGALTDRFGARVMFPAVSALTILPVLFVGLAGTSFVRLIIGGFFLGIGGTAFAVGSRWSTPGSHRHDAAWRSASSASAWAAPRCRRSAPSGWVTPTAAAPRSSWSRCCSPFTSWSPCCCCAHRRADPRPAARSCTAPSRRCGCRPLPSCPCCTRSDSEASSPSASTCPPTCETPTG